MATHDWLNIQTESGSEGTTQVTVSANSDHTGRVTRQKTITGTTSGSVTDTTVVSQAPAEMNATFDNSSYSIGAAATSLEISGKSNATTLTFAFTENAARFELPNTIAITSGSTSTTASLVNGVYTIPNDIGANAQYEFRMVLTCPANDSVSSKLSVLSLYGSAGGSNTTTVTANLSHAGGNSSIDMTTTISLGNKSGSSGTLTITSNDSWELSVS